MAASGRIPPIETFLVTCEHGGNRVPSRWRRLFEGRRELLESHRGHDAGAQVLARRISRRLGCPLVASTVSRLLVDLNRSRGHRKAFSEVTRALPRRERDLILGRHHVPYRARVETIVGEAVARGYRMIHLSCHTFTPVWNGLQRTTGLGLLFDPKRPLEAALCADWRRLLRQRIPSLTVHRNTPYRGDGDGLTTHLRTRFPPGAYLGIEIEVNQAIASGAGSCWLRLGRDLVQTLATARALPGSPFPGVRP